MNLTEALECAEDMGGPGYVAHTVCTTLAAEVRRLQAELERLPARRAQPTAKTAPIAPTRWQFWGIDETDEEFAERAGRAIESKEVI